MSESVATPGTTLVVFGATGDLMRRKVLPALHYLYEQGRFPSNFRIVGFSRRELTDDTYREFIVDALTVNLGKAPSAGKLKPFLRLFTFQRGGFDEAESYAGLRDKLESKDTRGPSNKLYYFSVAPEFYDAIFANLSSAGLTKAAPGAWTRVMIEKPFGLDGSDARKLESLLGTYYRDDQIYRIDHYYAKEMLQNLMTFRFENSIFEPSWSNAYIEKVHIRLFETLGVEKRGSFYDPVGAFRDVGQNHFLGMLALVAMKRPREYTAQEIQKSRAAILEKLLVHTEDDARTRTFRAQHRGYRDIPGVQPDSMTETFFKVRAELSDAKWKGVPFYLEGGKRLGAPQKEIVVTFKSDAGVANTVTFELEPKEMIRIQLQSKVPGFDTAREATALEFTYREQKGKRQYVEEYARLILDGIRGDQSLFAGKKEIAAMWRFTDPIIKAWQQNAVPLHIYEPDNKLVLEAAKYIEL